MTTDRTAITDQRVSTVRHFVLTTIVTTAEWRTGDGRGLARLKLALLERARRCELVLRDQPREQVEVLEGSSRVRLTVSADGVRPDQGPLPPALSLVRAPADPAVLLAAS